MEYKRKSNKSKLVREEKSSAPKSVSDCQRHKKKRTKINLVNFGNAFELLAFGMRKL